MDEKKKNIRLVRSDGRRVTDSKTEYDWNGLERRMDRETSSRQPSRARAQKKSESAGAGELRKKVSYQKKQKQHRLKMQRRRAALILALVVIFIFIILFLTPVFDIRSITVEGNSLVSEQQFTEVLEPLVGENLLRSGSGKIRRMLKSIPYIDKAEVQKKLFPPTVKITVTEYAPSAVIRTEGRNLVVTSGLHVLSEDGASPLSVPAVTGVEVSGYKLGADAKLTDEEKTAALVTILSTLEATGITGRIVEIDLNDLANIIMNYDSRISVQCGSALDLERKLRLFKEAVTSNSLAENARGTMDLSETGKAVYTP